MSSLFLFSCKKESSEDGSKQQDLLGSWKLLDMTVDGEISTQLTTDDMGSLKNAVLMDYVTENEKGGITFEESKLISSELAYDVTGTVTSTLYFDGVPTASFDSVINIPMPPSSASVDYVRVGTDSIYCPNGTFIHMEGAEDLESMPGGFKYRFEGDKLIMTIRQKELEVVTEEGMIQEDTTDITLVATFQKQ